jgi:hypothetical protein
MNGKTVMSFKISIASDWRLMSGDYVSHVIRYEQPQKEGGHNLQQKSSCNRRSQKYSMRGYVTPELSLMSGACVWAHTLKTDGTHTTTAGMRNVSTETPQPALWQGRSSAKDSSNDAQNSNLEQPMKSFRRMWKLKIYKLFKQYLLVQRQND